jgi:hypothetical protein
MQVKLRGGPYHGKILGVPDFVDWLTFCTDPEGNCLFQYHHYVYRGPACVGTDEEPGGGVYLDYNGVSDKRRQRRDDHWGEGFEWQDHPFRDDEIPGAESPRPGA